MDQDQSVQEAACTAISALIEQRPEQLNQFILEILQYFNMVIDHYKGNSLMSLFDAIGCLADSLGENLKNEAIVAKLMPLLVKKWDQLEDTNRSICPLFECFESVATGMGAMFEPFAPPVFNRCLKIITTFAKNLRVRF